MYESVTCFSAGPRNGTWRFDQVETMVEGNKSKLIFDFLIPVRLVVVQEPFGANETVPFLLQPKLVLLNKLNRTVSALGHGQQGQWYVNALACCYNENSKQQHYTKPKMYSWLLRFRLLLKVAYCVCFKPKYVIHSCLVSVLMIRG